MSLNEDVKHQAEIDKSFTQAFSDYGLAAVLSALVFVIVLYVLSYFFVGDYHTPLPTLIFGFVVLCFYFTFKPKLMAYIKGYRKRKDK
jgi:DMSO reductase anchor subunit